MGIDWGRTLSAMVDHLMAFRAATEVQIAGGALTPYGVSPADVPRRLAGRFDVESSRMHIPLFVSDPATGTVLRSDVATLEMFGRLIMAVIGLGAWAPEHANVVQVLAASDVVALAVIGVAADSFPMFFTADGRIHSGGNREHGIGITVDELQAVARRIGIAGGRSKAVALEAALHPGLFTHLVTDVAAAEVPVSGRS